MDFSQPSFIAAWIGSISFVWVLFDRAEKVTSSEAKEAASRWLRNLSLDLPQRWPSQFALLFDRIFGERHLSFKCFLRSCIASAISVAILSLICISFRYRDLSSVTDKASMLLNIGILMAIMNFVPDYISLLETRIIIKWMSRAHKSSRLAIFLVLDFIITGLIFSVAFLPVYLTFGLMLRGYFPDLEEVISVLKIGFLFREAGKGEVLTLGIFLYSTYFTSVWIWLYVISGILVRGTATFGSLFKWLKKVLDVDNQPFRSIGFVSMFVVSLGFLVLLFLG